jgi:hypothetical protein
MLLQLRYQFAQCNIDNLHANNTILNGDLTVTGNITGNTLSVTNGTSLGSNLSVAGNVTSAASVRIMQH